MELTDEQMAQMEAGHGNLPAVMTDEQIANLESNHASFGKLSSAALGAAQGASFGFADEGEGAIKAALDYLHGKYGDRPLSEIYRLERDAARQKYGQAEQQNPVSYKTGEIGGAVATSLIPGLGEANALKLGGMGAAYGLGGSNADLTKGNIVGAAKDTATGAAIGLGSGLIAPAVSVAGNLVKGGAKRAISNVFGPSAEAVNTRITNPSAIQNAKTYAEIADQVPATLEKIQQKITDTDTAAWNTLSRSTDPGEGAKPANDIIDLVKQARWKIGKAIGRADNKAQVILGEISDDLKNIYSKESNEYVASQQGLEEATNTARQYKTADEFAKHWNEPIYSESSVGVNKNLGMSPQDFWKQAQKQETKTAFENVSESDIKAIIQKIDANTDWDKPGAETTNNALKSLRNKLDTMLKDQNEDYRQAMVPVQQNIDLLNDAERFFVPKKTAGQGYSATDTTISKLSNLKREGKDVSKSIIEKIKDVTGDDYLTATKNADIANQFVGGKANGSRNTNRWGATLGTLGGGVGYAAGRGPGAAIGTGLGTLAGVNLGATIDKEGGKMAANIIDYYTAHPEQIKNISTIMQLLATKVPQAGAMTSNLKNQDNDWQQQLLNK